MVMQDRFDAAMESRVTHQARDVCPHCKRLLVEFAFLTPDRQTVKTWHCPEHGAVVPMRSAICNQVGYGVPFD